MARIETRLAKTLYFCNVKNRMRHVVAAEGSVFRATNLVEKLYPNECGSSNAHKGSAFGTLTARIGVLLCLKFMETNAKKLQDAQLEVVLCLKFMETNAKKLQDAQLEVVESIQEYLNDFNSVAELYERTAKATLEIIHVSNILSDEAKKLIGDMVDDHLCLLNLLKPLEEKGGEV